MFFRNSLAVENRAIAATVYKYRLLIQIFDGGRIGKAAGHEAMMGNARPSLSNAGF